MNPAAYVSAPGVAMSRQAAGVDKIVDPGGVYWMGTDGQRWVKDAQGVRAVGSFTAGANTFWNDQGYTQINDPNAQIATPDGAAASTSTGVGGVGGTGGAGASSAAAKLKARIAARGGEIDSAYGSLFGNLDNLVKSRDSALETQYGEQLKTAGTNYADALPEIDSSYAALGSYDSTQRGDSRGKAKTGFDTTVKTIGNNKSSDKAKLGQYSLEQKAKIQADKDAAARSVQSANDTTDESSLLSLANNLDQNLSQTGVTAATLAPDSAGQKAVTDLTSDNGRFQAAIDSLDQIMKSSMGTDVKSAAVKAVTDAGGLSDEEKKKVDAMYGNVYSEQAAL